jgi:Gluconate 2-dehydrogenase subunit 3
MPLPRRHFLFKLLPSALLTLLGISSLAKATSKPTPQPDAKYTLRHFLDQLLPADQWSGSASQLGIDQKFWQLAQKHPRYHQFLVNGSQWLDSQASEKYSKTFLQLSPEEAHPIIDSMTTKPPTTLPRRFFDNIRLTALRYYYSDKRSWNGLAIDHPPQPQGYYELLQPLLENKA